MNQRVLLVGDDKSVLQTRALLLQPLEVIQSSSADAPAILFSQSVDVVVIGQSIAGPTAERIIAAVKSLERVPELILIRFPGETVSLGIETHETNSWKNPGWLKERVMELLVERI